MARHTDRRITSSRSPREARSSTENADALARGKENLGQLDTSDESLSPVKTVDFDVEAENARAAKGGLYY
jgi:hypothetical protein